ncbi:MAG: tagaturonate epimerase family protein [Eubacteriales bacterium]|nr:tagaturonate epimerase family protein [Clostridiales bacterium]MDY3285522.1 tagaturonate epimerase family protein [Eubacteriales bacterium]MDY5015645.1 tagaturonate epimerase family protein [Eubacteriales bacterium]
MNYKPFVTGGCVDFDKYRVYPKSVRTLDGATFFMADAGDADVLVCVGKSEMPGKTRCGVTVSPCDHAAAEFLRRTFPFTAPVPVLSSPRTVGVGDRLGIAGPGHIRVFEKYDALPVLCQQSIRELNLTHRTYEDVLDASTFAVYREGFERGFGADGDHLKKPEDVAYALSLGFTMITLDCSEHIRGDGGSTVCPECEARYLGKTFDVGEGQSVTFTADELAKIVYIYGEAIDFAVSIWDQFFASGENRADFEISIDETATPTTPLQHFFVANELTRRGVKIATMAPRFCGEFQKGVDYMGDLAQFEREMHIHAQIARHFGYKISVHSGSDKFSVFPCVGRETRGVFHVKTAGTNWLEAMRVVAEHDPALYREIHRFALASFDEARAYYHVTTDLTKIPDVDTLSDAELPALFTQNDARQLIHITYGLILSDERFHDRLYAFWRAHAEEYAAAVASHIGRHLALLGVAER